MPRLIQTQASSNVRARTHGIIRYMHNVYITQQKQINSVRNKITNMYYVLVRHAWMLWTTENLIKLNASKALWWGHWEPWLILTIVIDNMVQTNPPVPSCFNGVKGLVCSPFPPVTWVGGTVCRSWHCTSFNVEVLVVSIEWCFAPIYFLQSTPCGPVICFPQCRIHSHCLHLWVWNPPSLVVFVYSDWKIIHVESARIRENSSLINYNNTKIE